MFDYPHLEVLLSVEREQSLEGAANALDVTKSALSQTLRLLEERQGAVVLNRAEMMPTSFGAKLCRHYEHVSLLEQSFFESHAHLFSERPTKTHLLRIGVPDDTLVNWITDIAFQTNKGERGFLVDTELVNETAVAKALADHRLCGALTTTEFSIPGMLTFFAGTHTVRAVAAPDFVKRHFSRGVTREAIQQAPALRYDHQEPHMPMWLERNLHDPIMLNSNFLPSSQAIANVCVAGIAWGMVSSLICDPALFDGGLVELIPESGLVQPLYWHVSAPLADVFKPITQALCAHAAEASDSAPGDACGRDISLIAD